MIKAVIFDLDNTLCDTLEVLEEAVRVTLNTHLSYFPGKSVDELMELNNKALKELDADPTLPIPSVVMLIWPKVFEYIGIKPKMKKVWNLISGVEKEILKRVSMTEGALEVLRELKSRGMLIGVLSNGPFVEQSKKLSKFGLDDYIDWLVTPELCQANKPDKRAFRFILEKLEVKPSEVLMVGDDLIADMSGGKNAGLKTVLFAPYRKKISPQEAGSDFAITSLKELFDIPPLMLLK